MLRIYKGNDYDEASRIAANIVSAQVLLKPDSVLGLATGSSPIGIYQNLIEKYKDKELDFSEVKSINLDEYKGLSGENSQSYRYFMNNNLFWYINIKMENTYVPDGLKEAEEACRSYNEIIQTIGPADLQILGLGLNGHIGFNEPSSLFEKGTHCVNLAQSTIEANARFFDSMDQVPKQAYTIGIKNILESKKILVIVSGKEKADILKTVFQGPVTPKVPASILQMHANVTLVADSEALSEM